MAFDISTDLIEKVQSSLRNESGLPTYDPHDPSIPPLPSFDDSIAVIDPIMSEDTKCRKCNKKLLRGTESLVCIYCGNKLQNQEHSSQSISYNSTFACQWLLQSIDSDQSETVDLFNENFALNRGQRTPKRKVSLHDLLHFQMTLTNESEKPKTSVRNKILEQSNSSLNLTGAYLDNVFSGSQTNIVFEAPEEPVLTKQIESNQSETFVGEENCTSVSSVPLVDTVVGTSEHNSCNLVSGQEAEFPSASKQDSSGSPDCHVDSIGGISSQMDSVFGPIDDQTSAMQEDDSMSATRSMGSDTTQDDLQSDVDSKVSQHDEQFDGSVEAKDGPSADSLTLLSSEGGECEDQCQANATGAPSDSTIAGHDDSLDK